ncbi:hypothetical protein [Calothrix sp. PCC 7507]|uniref:hypothetical protein n=1 Tax=Calothrix sp. PCC 7507 TaxID=99598 RepID=UPI00029EC3EF|nr:hypothetical protein [Calothrix sp. PCC 7507]AFY33290.1 hypothetical protein Cal7507_2875 [Calothrix sp. PCC 7507]
MRISVRANLGKLTSLTKSPVSDRYSVVVKILLDRDLAEDIVNTTNTVCKITAQDLRHFRKHSRDTSG